MQNKFVFFEFSEPKSLYLFNCINQGSAINLYGGSDNLKKNFEDRKMYNIS